MQYHRPGGVAYLTFEYNVIRIWETSVENLLAAGSGILPLAPLANVTLDGLPEIVRRMRDRLNSENMTNAEEAEFWTATSLLLGLRLPPAQVSELLKGVRQMRESSTYQAILLEGEAKGRAEGRAEEARRMVLRQGRRRFGDPPPATLSTVEAMSSVDRLEQLGDRLLEVKSWDELLSESTAN